MTAAPARCERLRRSAACCVAAAAKSTEPIAMCGLIDHAT